MEAEQVGIEGAPIGGRPEISTDFIGGEKSAGTVKDRQDSFFCHD